MMKKFLVQFVVLTLVSLFMVSLIGCGSEEEGTNKTVVSSRSYKGHENDKDSNNICSAYPAIVGTRLDDCQTCHVGKMDTVKNEQTTNACDYCHELMVYGTDKGRTFAETLNAYGTDYSKNGRTLEAIEKIKNLDSDGDGFANDKEIKELKYPGSNLSKPGQPNATTLTVSLEKVQAMTANTLFMLSNTSKQQFDDYADYKGVTVKNLLSTLGIDTTGATGVSFIAPDGFVKTIKIDQVNKSFPKGLFYSGLDVKTLGAECGFVNYAEKIPAGLTNGGTISDEPWLMIAYERDGKLMDPCYLDAVQLKLNGEGPFRLIVPQSTPGSPDRGQGFSPSKCNDGFDYDSKKDHNAGSMVRGVMAIRVDPLPAGVEEFDYKNGGWAYINSKELLIYGHNVK
jgi:hypothetical protein